MFRSWGRIGTTIGDKRLERMEDKQDAIRAFEGIYEERTGNSWHNRSNFQKVPGCYFPMDIDYGQVLFFLLTLFSQSPKKCWYLRLL